MPIIRVMSILLPILVKSCLLLFSASSFSAAEPQSRETHVFIVAGQSNAVGFAWQDGKQSYPSSVKQYARTDSVSGRSDGEIIQINNYGLDNWRKDGTNFFSFALQFSIEYVEENPNVDLILIPAAYSGTGFVDGRWGVDRFLYTDAVTRANDLFDRFPDYELKGWLWHQGENDGDHHYDLGVYKRELDQMLNAIRTDIAAANESTPIVIGQLAKPEENDGRKSVNAILRDTPNRVENVIVVESDGISTHDGTHFDQVGTRELGRRYYLSYKSIAEVVSDDRATSTPARPAAPPDLAVNE